MMRKNFIHHLPFKVLVVLILVGVAVYLKGEKLTVGALIAMVADLLSEIGMERAFNRE